MKKILKRVVLFSLLFSLVLFYTGCKKEPPLEKAEKQLKKALDEAKKKLKDAKESTGR